MSATARADDEPARQVLVRLLALAERARLRGDVRPVSLPMTEAGAGEYHAAKSWAERERFHAAMELAQRDGAIALHWQPHRDDPLLLRVTVADVGALARHLDIALLSDRIAEAQRVLSPWPARFPVIDAILERWRDDKRVRGRHCESARDLADAARAVAARQDNGEEERILRRESVRLFGHSKRLEALTPWLDILICEELTGTGLENAQIWAALGLRREPQPLLLAGSAIVRLDDDGALTLPRPYLGVAPESLRAVDTHARCLLTVENLASFHDMARRATGEAILVLYTGGMPSPTWRAAYARILRSLPEDTALLHWGDIDEGGFRIAAVLADAARATGRTLHPWLMSPDDLPDDARHAASPASRQTQAAMVRFAERAGWPQVARAIARTGLLLEQERLDPALPMPLQPATASGPSR